MIGSPSPDDLVAAQYPDSNVWPAAIAVWRQGTQVFPLHSRVQWAGFKGLDLKLPAQELPLIHPGGYSVFLWYGAVSQTLPRLHTMRRHH
jgi:hypothetical protein